MTATTIAAWVGATTGVSGLLWDIYKWKFSGPRLTVQVQTGMVKLIAGRKTNMDERSMVVRVRNSGKAPTTVTTVSFVKYDSWWKRQRQKWSEGGIVFEPKTTRPLPHKLDIGEEWGGIVSQNQSTQAMIDSGKLWCEVYHSWSRHPGRCRIVPKPATSMNDETRK